ncbi:ROK family protein [Sphingomonas sp. Leaf21]|uniref:ROK family protein n=1 Tax=Sphingomonas sp. Leaf21 TaxID=2876550 RepID=UPI002E7A0B85|nr:ROK family protein [Sphingomonas sp. Leaf21]
MTLVTLDLAGTVRSRVTREMRFPMPQDLLSFLRDALDTAIAQGGVDRTRVVGVGIAMPDKMGSIAIPHAPSGYAIWDDTDLPRLLADLLPWPIHLDNDAAAAALVEAEYGTGFDNPNFFYLLISAGLGGGLVIDRHYRRGASNRSGEIGLMPDPGLGSEDACVQDTVSVSALLDRLAAAGYAVPDVPALADLPDEAEPTVARWVADSVRALTGPIIAVNCLVDPNAILIGGRLPGALIARLADALGKRLAGVAMPRSAPILPASIAQDAPAVGAAILPFLDHLVPSDATLIQAGR